jgi:hypothetical protein
MFQQPSQGDRIDMNELLGSLVLIWVRELREGITTRYGDREAIACDVHCLDGPKGGEKFENALIFQGALIGSLRSAVGGDPVLARIGQGVARPGQNPPFVLQPYANADAAVATSYIQRMPKPFRAAASGNGAAPAAPAAEPPPGGMTAGQFAALPPEVQALLRQTA